jgi:hypothetical protein
LPSCEFFLSLRLKIKLKSRHFDIVEGTEAGSQAVLNTLTEHDFQTAFKNGTSTGNGAYEQNETTSRVMVVSRTKVSFDQMAASVSEIIDSFTRS